MKTFKDAEGGEWKVVVNVGTAKRVRDLTTVNIFNLYQDEAEKVFTDPCLLVDVIYVLCQDQCQERHMSDVDFGRAMTGDALEQAATALLEEVADFFPSSRRNILRKVMAKSDQMAKQLEAKALDALEKMSVESLPPST